MKRKLQSAILAMALTLGTAGAATIGHSLVAPTAAEAWSVGGAIKGAAKGVAKAGKAVGKAGKAVGKGVGKAGKAVGKTAGKVGVGVARNVKRGAVGLGKVTYKYAIKPNFGSRNSKTKVSGR